MTSDAAADSPKRVLFLDDERVIADTLAIIVNQHGFVARAAYNHTQAVQIAREFRPNIFVTGFVNLCEKTGCETAAEIVDLLGSCHVFVITGSGYKPALKAVEHCRQRGYHFIVKPKPVHPTDLLAWLNEASQSTA